MAIMAIACSFAVPGCGRQEQEQKTETEADHAPQELVQETDQEQKEEGEKAAVEERTETEDVTAPDVPKREPAEKDTVPLPPDQEPVVSKEVITPEEKIADASDANDDDGLAYVGVKKCKNCHLKQYRSWASTNMATSFENLTPGVKAEAKKQAGLDPNKDYTHDETCLRCHTTGYGKPGGFVNLEATPEMINVQCETCHGPGIEYGKLMKENKEYAISDATAAGLVIPSDDREGCLQCHGGDNPFNETVDPKYAFHFDQRLERSHEHLPLKRQH
jgi:type II secretory pathway pseudopilin PulG